MSAYDEQTNEMFDRDFALDPLVAILPTTLVELPVSGVDPVLLPLDVTFSPLELLGSLHMDGDLWFVIPEPATALLVATGLLGLATARRFAQR